MKNNYDVIYSDWRDGEKVKSYYYQHTLEQIIHEFEQGWKSWDTLEFVLLNSKVVWSREENSNVKHKGEHNEKHY